MVGTQREPTETMPRNIERVPSWATPMSRVLEMGRYIAVRIIKSACSHTKTRAITAVIWTVCHLLIVILLPSVCIGAAARAPTASVSYAAECVIMT